MAVLGAELLAVEEDGLGTIIYEREGPNAVSLDTYVGRRVEMHCTALGKAILAHFPEERVEEILDRYGLTAETEHTITDRAELEDNLERIREQGYAISSGERIPGLGCIAVPVIANRQGDVDGALSLCAPLARIKPLTLPDEMLDMMRQTANRIELDMAFD
ncbi:IclR family transcriptional regulator [Natrinema gelatinilyticum]|uniref:IclR family transcriptional regulator n=1 Tax=Natrinema gelatinilyticum TaxID=2961571 RepID=UPI0020C3AE63|nr:IclR family transcriptional regulator C-terminal domain-containing protein [Natrinema gelatinilyticum]